MQNSRLLKSCSEKTRLSHPSPSLQTGITDTECRVNSALGTIQKLPAAAQLCTSGAAQLPRARAPSAPSDSRFLAALAGLGKPYCLPRCKLLSR